MGDLDVGAKTVVRVEFNVPETVRQVLITEAGTLKDVKGARSAFLETQTFVP